MKSTQRILTMLLFFICQEAYAIITISGTGYSMPLGDHPRTKVTIYRKPSMQRLKTTYTDDQGYYSANLYITSDRRVERVTPFSAVPNPGGMDVRAEYFSEVTDNGILTVIEPDGKIKMKRSITLKPGKNEIIISGLGVKGTKLITLSLSDKQYTCKAITSISSDGSPDVRVANVENFYKAAEGDSLYITFEPVDSVYIGMDTTVITATQEVNYHLHQQPYIYDFTMKPFTINGEPVTQLTVSFDWIDSSTDNYSTDDAGYIHIYKELYYFDDTAVLTLDTTDLYEGNNSFLTWTIGRSFQQPTNVPNLFQNPQTPPPGFMQYNPPPPAPVNLMLLPDTFALYVIPKKVPCPYSYDGVCVNDSVRLDDYEVVATLYGGWSLDILHYIHVPQVTDSVDMIQFAWHEAGYSCDTAALDSAMAMLTRFMNVYTLPNGDKLFPPYRIYRIYSTDDPRYQAVAARMGDNSFTTQFGGNHGGPGFECTYCYNNGCRQGHGNSCYWGCVPGPLNNSTVIHEFGHGLCGFACNSDMNCDNEECLEPSILFKSIMRIKAMLNLGTYY